MILKKAYFHLGWPHDNGEEDMVLWDPNIRRGVITQRTHTHTHTHTHASPPHLFQFQGNNEMSLLWKKVNVSTEVKHVLLAIVHTSAFLAITWHLCQPLLTINRETSEQFLLLE